METGSGLTDQQHLLAIPGKVVPQNAQARWFYSSVFSTTIVHSVTSAAMAPMAARVGNSTAPTTPSVSGISIRVFPSLVLDGDTADVPLPHQFLDRRDQLLAADGELLFSDLLFVHGCTSL